MSVLYEGVANRRNQYPQAVRPDQPVPVLENLFGIQVRKANGQIVESHGQSIERLMLRFGDRFTRAASGKLGPYALVMKRWFEF